MATLVLTTVGTAIAGPVGGAIGALIGGQADAAIFAPKRRQGPRLGDLAVQISSYGSAIPRIFGTMRVAGTVIWATDLREDRTTSGGGKGQPATTSYSYSASFAVALSARPIRGVRRIWADGKLLRGAGGDFKTRCTFRLYQGDEDQPVDPLIASVEGIGQAPAFRGIAYALFEDLQLADFGNRIPSLTFEVEADADPVTLGAIAGELSGGAVGAGATPALSGYAASGDSIRGALEALADVVPLSLSDDGAGLLLTAEPGELLTLYADDEGARAEQAGGRSEFARRAAGSVADEVAIAYYDVARDYQTGLQRASLGSAGQRPDRRALPAVLTAEAAKALAERRLAAHGAGRETATLHLGWRRSALRPGTHLSLDGRAGLWKIQRWSLEHMVVRLELVREPSALLPSSVVANPGRPIGHPDLVHGPTTLHLLDLPLSGADLPDRPRLFALAAGVEPGWRHAELTASYDGGASWTAAGRTAATATIGVAETVLHAGQSALLDEQGSLVVSLLNDAMWLESRSDAALAGGANLASLGDELIQFGQVDPLGARRFRLSRLLRGRRGTEWAMAAHGADEAFCLIEAETIAAIDPPLAAMGGEARVAAAGIGDGPDGVLALRTVSGEAVRPPSPVHLKAATLGNGDILIEWVRRSRRGWVWLDGGDAPLGEESEAYRLSLRGDGFERTTTLGEPLYVYSAAEQAADGATGTFVIEVAQIGTLAASRVAEIHHIISGD